MTLDLAKTIQNNVKKNNIYKIIFNGSTDYFLEIMKDKNYEFDTQNQIWTVK